MNGMSAFLSGATLSLAITVPVGPNSILCIQRSLRSGVIAGFATGLGAATVLLFYTMCVVLGFGPALALLLGENHAPLSAVSACLLLWLSLRVLSRRVSLAGGGQEGCGAMSAYCSAVACAALNPMTPALLAAVLPTMATPEPSAAASMITGVFSASAAWWLIVSGSASILRTRLNVTVLTFINRVSGLALGVLGMVMAANAVNLRF